MAKTKTPAKRKPRAKQGYLDPEMAPPSIPAIDRAADDYCEARDARMEALQVEIDRKTDLKALMQANNLQTYEYDGKIVTLDGDPQVKVKKKKTPKDDAE